MTKRKKTGGRQEGTPNKVTGNVRQMISKSLNKEMESLPKLLSQLEPKDRVNAIFKFVAYIIPKADESTDVDKKSEKSWLQSVTEHIQNVYKENHPETQENPGNPEDSVDPKDPEDPELK